MRSIRNILGILIFATIFAITSSHAQQGVNAVLQSAAVANGNGTEFLVAGNSGSILTVNCNACAGGTTVNFEASEDGTNYTAISAFQVGTSTNATSTTTSGITVWQISVSGMVKFRARISAYSAGTITVTGHAYPVANGSTVAVVGSGATAQQVQGTNTTGTAPVGNSLMVAWDGTLSRLLKTDTAGDLATVASVADADGIANNPAGMTVSPSGTSGPLEINPHVFNGSTWDRARSVSATNAGNSTQLGVNLVDYPGQWAIFSQPVAATQASTNRPAVVSTRHVAKSVTVCISAVAAQPDIIFNLRDGASGAGTVVWTIRMAATAGTSQCQTANFTIVGSNNTAMSIESAAAPAATNFASVSMSGYDIQ